MVLIRAVRRTGVFTSTARVVRSVGCTAGTLTDLVAQRTASEAADYGAHRPERGAYCRASCAAAYSPYRFRCTAASRIGCVVCTRSVGSTSAVISSTSPIAIVVLSH